MFQQTAKPVDLIVIEPTRIDAEPIEAGTVLKQVPPDLAMELAAAGKVRVATKDLVEEFKERAKQAKQLAEAQAGAADVAKVAADERMAATVAAAVAAALQAAGVVPAPAPATQGKG